MTKHPIPCPKISLEIITGLMVMMSHWLEQKIQKGPRVMTRGPRAELTRKWNVKCEHVLTTYCQVAIFFEGRDRNCIDQVKNVYSSPRNI